MALIDTETAFVFDENEIQPRSFVRAKYHTWDEARNGLVIHVSKDRIMAVFFPMIHQAMRFYVIKADEVGAGKWEILYSSDLETIGKVGYEDVDNGDTDSQETIPE